MAKTTPTLSASPNPVKAGQVVTFSGGNFPVGQVFFWIAGAMSGTYSFDGTVSFDWPYFTVPGTYEAFAYWGRTNHQQRSASIFIKVQ